MADRDVFAALAALVTASCGGGGGDARRAPHECSGAAVIITAIPSPAAVVIDGGMDANSSTDGGGDNGKPSCTGSCYEYLESLRVAVEAATPAACTRLSFGTSLSCVPSSASRGCPNNSIDDGHALEAQIRAYLSASWPEIDSPLSIDYCPCRIY